MSRAVDSYRRQWPRVGALLAMAVGGGTALAGSRLSAGQTLSAANFITLLAHQYEEYQDPGYFPGQFNRGMFGSDSPRNYPLNPQTAMIINTGLAYPFYIAPIVFPKVKWLGLGAVLLGWFQAVLHGIVIPRRAKAAYGPGFLTALLLHVPIGIAYIRALRQDEPIRGRDWIQALVCAVLAAAFGVVGPNLLLRNPTSPYRFTAAQMGRYDVAA